MQQGLASTAVGKQAPSASASETRVLAAVQALARGPGGTVRLVDLRDRLEDMRRTDLDQALFRLEAAAKVSLARVVDLATVTPAERKASIHDSLRGMLLYVHSSVENRNTVSW